MSADQERIEALPTEVRAQYRTIYYRGDERLGPGALLHSSVVALGRLAQLSIEVWPDGQEPPDRFEIEVRYVSEWETLL